MILNNLEALSRYRTVSAPRAAGLVLAMMLVAAAVAGLSGCSESAQANRSGQHTQTPDGDSVLTARVFGDEGELTEPIEVERLELTEDEWRERLTKSEFYILREKGTERAFTGDLLNNKKTGYYVCAACELPLFHSETKFESGTGWPSFYEPVATENVGEIEDRSLGVVRTEVVCARCGGHLGHVFQDGPADKTGLRYCINSVSLDFVDKEKAMTLAKNPAEDALVETQSLPKVGDRLPEPAQDTTLTQESGEAKAVFAGGCFWCTEAVFQEIDGVSAVVSGYTGGDPARADYKSVCTGTTGHAECIEITYDPSRVTYGQLLRIFFATHDPTQLNRQGPDTGSQYRSAVFYANEEQKTVAHAYIKQLSEAGTFKRPIVTQVEELEEFFPAEDYHQDFMDKNPGNPYVQRYAAPKVQKVRKVYADRLKTADKGQ